MTRDEMNLIEGYIDGTLSEVQLKQVRALIECDEKFRNDLAEALRFQGLGRATACEQYDNLAEAVSQAIETPTKPSASKSFRFSSIVWWIIIILLVQTVLVVVLYNGMGTSTSQVTTKETHTELWGQVSYSGGSCFLVRNKAKVLLKEGVQVFTGDQIFIEDSGVAIVSLSDGSEIRLLDRTYVLFNRHGTRRQLLLYSGYLLGIVKESMDVITEHAMTSLRHDEFEISSSDVSTLVEATTGSLWVEKVGEKKSVELQAGNYVVATPKETIVPKSAGHPLFRSDLVTKKTAGHKVAIRANITGAKKLYLVVTNGGDSNRFDHIAWLNPKLIGRHGTLDLTTLKWKSAKSGYRLAIANHGLYGHSIRVEDKRFDKGICTHSTSVIEFELPEGYDTFVAEGALLDTGVKQPESVPSVRFEVYTSLPERKLKTLQIRKIHY